MMLPQDIVWEYVVLFASLLFQRLVRMGLEAENEIPAKDVLLRLDVALGVTLR